MATLETMAAYWRKLITRRRELGRLIRATEAAAVELYGHDAWATAANLVQLDENNVPYAGASISVCCDILWDRAKRRLIRQEMIFNGRRTFALPTDSSANDCYLRWATAPCED